MRALLQKLLGKVFYFVWSWRAKYMILTVPVAWKYWYEKNPLFCSLNFLWSMVWNPWVSLTWMWKPWIVEQWMLKSWKMEWMLWGEEAKKKEKKKFCCKVWDGKGWGCLGSKGGSRAGKSSCTHWWGIDQLCSVLCAAQVLPPEYSVKAVEIKAWLLLRKRMTHNVNFFSLFFFSVGRRAEFNVFLSPSILLQCFAVRPGRLASR